MLHLKDKLPLDEDDWLRKRRKTFYAFCGISFGLGFEISIMFPSLYFYMSDIIKTPNPKLFYGIALSAYPVSSIIGAFTIGKYADRTKSVRIVILYLLTCEIVGNFLYSFPYSCLFPIVGRLIAGFGDVACLLIVAEIQRSYEYEEITSRISVTVVCFSIGFIFSPGVTILFKMFDFYIGTFHVVYANMASLTTTTIFTILWIWSFINVSDLSKEFDLKESKRSSQEDGIEKITARKSSESSPLLTAKTCSGDEEVEDLFETESEQEEKELFALKQIFSSFDLCLLLVFCFVCSFILFGFDTMVPLIGSTYFNFGVQQTSIIYIIDGVIYGFLLLALGKLSEIYADFYLILCAVVIALFGLVTILCIKFFHTNIYFNYACLTVYILSFSSAWCIEEVLTRSLFGKLVPSACQSYAEGIRRSVSNVAFIISGVTNAGLFEYITFIAVTLIVITLVLLVVFYHRREALLSPAPQFYVIIRDKDDDVIVTNEKELP